MCVCVSVSVLVCACVWWVAFQIVSWSVARNAAGCAGWSGDFIGGYIRGGGDWWYVRPVMVVNVRPVMVSDWPSDVRPVMVVDVREVHLVR